MGFENLRVYQAAELLDKLIQEIIKEIPRGHADEVNNMRRSVASIPHNIAEADGVEEAGRKRFHLSVARGSTDETRSALRKFARDGVVDQRKTIRPSTLCITVAKMLTSWINTIPPN